MYFSYLSYRTILDAFFSSRLLSPMFLPQLGSSFITPLLKEFPYFLTPFLFYSQSLWALFPLLNVLGSLLELVVIPEWDLPWLFEVKTYKTHHAPSTSLREVPIDRLLVQFSSWLQTNICTSMPIYPSFLIEWYFSMGQPLEIPNPTSNSKGLLWLSA